jgi:hypothetical protein
MKLDRANASAMKWIKSMAIKDGFTEEELLNCTLDGFGKKTKSHRTMRLVRLAYYKGWMRGVESSEEAHTPVTLDAIPIAFKELIIMDEEFKDYK